jgi:hypothetical protein
MLVPDVSVGDGPLVVEFGPVAGVLGPAVGVFDPEGPVVEIFCEGSVVAAVVLDDPEGLEVELEEPDVKVENVSVIVEELIKGVERPDVEIEVADV